MMDRLKGKVAIVTGAGTGIGAATSLLFAEEGADLVLAGRRVEPLEKMAAVVRSVGRECLVVPTDVSMEKQVESLFDAAMKTYGHVDVLFNNGGVGSGGPHTMLTFDEARYYRISDIDLKGVMLCCKYALRIMTNQGHGSIVNNASLTGTAGNSLPIYGAAKAGVINLTQSMALQHAAQGVRVNSISPGWVLTPMTETAGPKLIAERCARIPLGRRYADRKEGAGAVLLWASEEASYITGTNIIIDGGLSAG